MHTKEIYSLEKSWCSHSKNQAVKQKKKPNNNNNKHHCKTKQNKSQSKTKKCPANPQCFQTKMYLVPINQMLRMSQSSSSLISSGRDPEEFGLMMMTNKVGTAAPAGNLPRLCPRAPSVLLETLGKSPAPTSPADMGCGVLSPLASLSDRDRGTLTKGQAFPPPRGWLEMCETPQISPPAMEGSWGWWSWAPVPPVAGQDGAGGETCLLPGCLHPLSIP